MCFWLEGKIKEYIKTLADTCKYIWTQATCMRLHLAMKTSGSREHFHMVSPLSSTVSVSFLISAFSLLSDCISTFIWYSQNALLCSTTFLTLKGGCTCQFLQREQQISLHCSTAVQSSGQQLRRLPACQNTSLPCKLLYLIFFVLFFDTLDLPKHPLWAKGSLEGEKKVFSSHFKIQPLKQLEPMLIGEVLCPGGFMTTGSKGWVFQLGAFCGYGMEWLSDCL